MKTSNQQDGQSNLTNSERSQPETTISQNKMPSATGERAQTETRRLAWAVSITLFFLTIGVLGARYPTLLQRVLPPYEQTMTEPIVLQPDPLPLPPDPGDPAPPPDPTQPDPQPPAVPEPPKGSGPFPIPPVPPGQPPKGDPLPSPAPGFPGTNSPPVTPLPPGGSSGHHPPPIYPAKLLKAGVQGTVVIKIEVDALGRKQAVEVKVSSGHRELDDHAKKWIQQYWTQFPSTGGPQIYHTPLTFVIAPAGTRGSAKANP